jgi:hypothetical protein
VAGGVRLLEMTMVVVLIAFAKPGAVLIEARHWRWEGRGRSQSRQLLCNAVLGQHSVSLTLRLAFAAIVQQWPS